MHGYGWELDAAEEEGWCIMFGDKYCVGSSTAKIFCNFFVCVPIVCPIKWSLCLLEYLICCRPCCESGLNCYINEGTTKEQTEDVCHGDICILLCPPKWLCCGDDDSSSWITRRVKGHEDFRGLTHPRPPMNICERCSALWFLRVIDHDLGDIIME